MVIQLPVCLNRDPNRLREVGESFLARGFGLALTHGGGDQRWVEQLPLGGPLYLKIDPSHLPSGPALAGLVQTCHERGIHTLIKRVETQDDWSSALLARVSHVQGFAVGRPAAEPRPGFFSWIGNKGIAI